MAVTRTAPSKAVEPKSHRSPRRVPKIAPAPIEYDPAAHQKEIRGPESLLSQATAPARRFDISMRTTHMAGAVFRAYTSTDVRSSP